MSVVSTVPFVATADEADVYYVHEDLTGDASGGTASFSCKFPLNVSILSLSLTAQARGATLYPEVSILNLPEASSYFRLPLTSSLANGSITNSSQGVGYIALDKDTLSALPAVRSAVYLNVAFYNANATAYTLHAIMRVSPAGARRASIGQRLAGHPETPSAIVGAGTPAPVGFPRRVHIRPALGGIIGRRNPLWRFPGR